MATAGGPNIPKRNSIAVLLDPSNVKSTSFPRDQNILDYSTWQLNGTSATGFSRNGTSEENAIISATGPFGETTLVWETRCDATSNADGGWNGSFYSVDSSKTYRLSVWVKRTSSSSSGTFYLGTNGGGQPVQRLSNFTDQTNPYWECRGVSGYTQNVWYLVVGHVFPYTYASSTGHPDSGRYTIASGRIGANNGCNVGADMRMKEGTTSLRHRTYHYYSTNDTVRLQFAYPRMDLVDGTEPSIDELLSGKSRSSINLANRDQQFYLSNNTRITQRTGLPAKFDYVFELDGTDEFVAVDSIPLSNTFTILAWIKTSSSGGSTRIVYGPSANGHDNWLAVDSSDRVSFFGTQSADTNNFSLTGGTVTAGTWTQIGCTVDGNTAKIYQDGEELNSVTKAFTIGGWSSTASIGRRGGIDSNYFPGDIGKVICYRTVLTPVEIKQAFNSQRARFGI